ncbi:hypothetical protein DICSQDRAFT_181922 [Dichomitus squalens LYAD-421 SS1]|uniref:F-box domain-containing protein n=1 Tax=Dichomitus squalens (strain LYAD-421) TaxID=732165 RepID=R7SUJ9_DICSQ|nr:uncharacterized protein DICSQDRAFT_181922 [Dichomitus squalens LYAD-421 SS1]EJF59593.1 hypothetical protein DICSQDRAFT_181922 [Dichomitus squalens LYAD-421 SS1]
MLLRIPPEIIDEIIGWIDHPGTLRSSCLVCHDWLPASRHRLLGIVYIPDAVTYDLFLTRVVRCEDMRACLASIRTFVIGDGKNPDLRAPTIFHDLAGLLPSLDTLILDSLDWIKHPPHPRAPLTLSRFANVRELGLFSITFPSFGYFRRMVTFLPSLARLTLSDFTWPHPHQTPFYDVAPEPQTTPHLKSILVLSDVQSGVDRAACLNTLLVWLSRSPFRRSLRSASVPEGILGRKSGVLWNDIGPSLTALEIHSTRPFCGEPVADLTGFPNLQCLSILMTYRWSTVLNVTRTVTSHLHDLLLLMRVPEHLLQPPDTGSWRKPDELQALRFYFNAGGFPKGDDERKAISHQILQLFSKHTPKLYARGILTVDFLFGANDKEIMRNYWRACSPVSQLREFGSKATCTDSPYMNRLDEMD